MITSGDVTLSAFNSLRQVRTLVIRHWGRADATTLIHNVEGEGDAFCDVNDTIEQFHLAELRGWVVGNCWQWNGQCEPSDGRGHAISAVQAE